MRSRLCQALASAHDDKQRLAVLQMAVEEGPSQWWAIPVALASSCSARKWEDETLVCAAVVLHRVWRSYTHMPADSGNAHAQRSMLLSALRPHPGLTALVALMAGEHRAMVEAASKCSASEVRQVTRITLASIAQDEGKAAGRLELNLASWFCACRDLKRSRAGSMRVEPNARPQHARTPSGRPPSWRTVSPRCAETRAATARGAEGVTYPGDGALLAAANADIARVVSVHGALPPPLPPPPLPWALLVFLVLDMLVGAVVRAINARDVSGGGRRAAFAYTARAHAGR